MKNPPEFVNAYLLGNEICLLSRDESGVLRQRMISPEYVSYVKAADIPSEFSRALTTSRFVRSYKSEGEWIRIGWANRFARDDMMFGRRGSDPVRSPFEERGITTYEGDVHPVRRYLTDAGAKIQRPRRAYFDLETDSRVPFSRKEEMRILSWAVVTEDGEEFSGILEADTDAAECGLLIEFFNAIAGSDQILAWNGDRFDFPVLRARVAARGLRIDMDRWLWLDHLLLFKRMNTASESGDEKTSMKLQDVAMSLLGEGKDDFDASKTWEAWAAGGESRERMLRYNIKDTALLPKIEAKTGSAALLDTIADVCTVFPDTRGLNPTVQMDGYMLREGLARGIHFITKKHFSGTSEKYGGAFVLEPTVKGVLSDVHVCDFASLYPSIILTWNMSPETKSVIPPNGPIPEGNCRSPITGQGFTTGAPGILSDALKRLLTLRKDWNATKTSLPPGTQEWHEADRRSTAYKVAANSFYGVLGTPHSRFFDKRIAESITKNGEWLLKQTFHEAEKRGMEIIYADTDSVFVRNATRTEFEEFVRWCNSDLYPRLVKEIGCVENHIKLAYEKQFQRIVFTSAKRYAGQYAHYKGTEATAETKPEIKGLEYKRGDTSLLARRLQEQVIMRIVVDGDERIDTYRGMIADVMQHVLHDELPVEEVAISKGLSKALKEYIPKKKLDGNDAAVPAHVRVARLLADRGQEVGEGTRISFVVVDGDGGINLAIPASDFDGVTFDRYYLWEKLVYPPTHRLLESAFPDADWVSTLERIRPPKPRGRRKAAPVEQLGMSLDAPNGVGAAPEFSLDLSERMLTEDALKALRAVAERHPGIKTLVLNLALDSGAVAVLATGLSVSGSPAFLLEAWGVIWEGAALKEWEIETCGR